MRRRAIGLGVLGLGAFLLAAASGVRVFLVPGHGLAAARPEASGPTVGRTRTSTYFDLAELEAGARVRRGRRPPRAGRRARPRTPTPTSPSGTTAPTITDANGTSSPRARPSSASTAARAEAVDCDQRADRRRADRRRGPHGHVPGRHRGAGLRSLGHQRRGGRPGDATSAPSSSRACRCTASSRPSPRRSSRARGTRALLVATAAARSRPTSSTATTATVLVEPISGRSSRSRRRTR